MNFLVKRRSDMAAVAMAQHTELTTMTAWPFESMSIRSLVDMPAVDCQEAK
jgi:hypothetical protein